MTINSFIIMWIGLFVFLFFALWIGKKINKGIQEWSNNYYGQGSWRYKLWKIKYRRK